MVDRVAKASPFEPEGLECGAPPGCEPVVTPRRPRGRFLPGRLDEAVTAEAGQQRIDRPLAGDHPVHLGQAANEVEAVALLVGEQREHAVLQRPAPHLGEQRVLLSYHVLQGTWDYLISQRAR